MNKISIILFSIGLAGGACMLFPGCNGKNTQGEKKEIVSGNDAELDRLNQMVLKDSRNPDNLLQRARYFNKEKKFQNALNDIRVALAIDSTRADLWNVKAEAHFGLVEVPPAVDAFIKVTTLNPSDVEAWLKLAELNLYIKEYQKSLGFANSALKVDSKKSKAYFIKGFVYKETGDTARSISSFQTAVEQDPQYYEAHLQLGMLFGAKKNKLAVQYYSNALRLRPNSIEALYDRAMFYQETEDYNKAMEDYASILKLDPKNKEAYFNLGYIHLADLKVYRQAITHFTEAIQCDTTYIEAYYNRGVSFESLGDIENAAADYRKALSLYPAYEPAIQGLKRVK